MLRNLWAPKSSSGRRTGEKGDSTKDEIFLPNNSITSSTADVSSASGSRNIFLQLIYLSQKE